jgi:hypothetical protein
MLWITGVWKWRIVGGGEDRRYINSHVACGGRRRNTDTTAGHRDPVRT